MVEQPNLSGRGKALGAGGLAASIAYYFGAVNIPWHVSLVALVAVSLWGMRELFRHRERMKALDRASDSPVAEVVGKFDVR
jgi:hypothetical protein